MFSLKTNGRISSIFTLFTNTLRTVFTSFTGDKQLFDFFFDFFFFLPKISPTVFAPGHISSWTESP